MEPSATSTTITGPVKERLQVGTEDAPALDRPAPLRRLHDSGAGYKYPDLLTYNLVMAVQITGVLPGWGRYDTGLSPFRKRVWTVEIPWCGYPSIKSFMIY